ncbi:hypothetical protein [Methanolobus chelungpuianus]|uniref:4Fe-4S Mo/W bis-MGD-type domain-containing protein n=1 Tax=Methanolobus chelungpuianus TaxID=502115 RepID=A0AAE3HBV9_9EURY|nr:hypothetical protein [Methanolobus chelungpuianus]MCQ6963750.1 hypothetical protein [Methanolobus chelungpuianus]
MKESIYTTVCPGCSIGCGLYIRESDKGAVSVDFLKSSPVNLGKLCRFGMRLPHYYSRLVSGKAEGQDCGTEDAVRAAASRLKGAGKIAMLSVGNTTCEEHIAFMKLAETLGTVVHTGIPVYAQLPPECHPHLEGMPFIDIENAEKIVLFIDPYVQYPLLVRRLLAAKRNGAYIISAGRTELHLAHENRKLSPEQCAELDLDSGSLIITDVHPHTDPCHIQQLLNIALDTGARLQVMKPFVNSEGADRLAKSRAGMMGISQIMSGIERGDIRTLVLLDSDPVELMPDTSRAVEVLKKLEDLIVISSRDSPVNAIADVVIATEPLYRKKGTFINAEGKLQENSGQGIDGIDAISMLSRELGADGFDHRQVHGYLHERMIETLASENRKPEYCRMECGTVPAQQNGACTLEYMYNPFMWFSQPDDNGFVLLDRGMVKSLRLKKGGTVRLDSEKGSMDMRYKVEKVPEGTILTGRKLPIATATVTKIKAEGC